MIGLFSIIMVASVTMPAASSCFGWSNAQEGKMGLGGLAYTDADAALHSLLPIDSAS